MRKRDPSWRLRRALGHKVIVNRKRRARRLACRKKGKSAGSTTGICRRYPPRHNRDDPWLHPSRRKDLATQPHTCKTDFCGEWQEKHHD